MEKTNRLCKSIDDLKEKFDISQYECKHNVESFYTADLSKQDQRLKEFQVLVVGMRDLLFELGEAAV